MDVSGTNGALSLDSKGQVSPTLPIYLSFFTGSGTDAHLSLGALTNINII